MEQDFILADNSRLYIVPLLRRRQSSRNLRQQIAPHAQPWPKRKDASSFLLVDSQNLHSAEPNLRENVSLVCPRVNPIHIRPRWDCFSGDVMSYRIDKTNHHRVSGSLYWLGIGEARDDWILILLRLLLVCLNFQACVRPIRFMWCW